MWRAIVRSAIARNATWGMLFIGGIAIGIACSGAASAQSAPLLDPLFRISPLDFEDNIAFGLSVDISKDYMGIWGGGRIHVIDRLTGTELSSLVPTEFIDRSRFGDSFDIAGDLVVVSYESSSPPGRALVFDALSGENLLTLTASDGIGGDDFGSSVAAAGNRVIVGAPQHNDGGNNSGAAYVYDLNTGEELLKLLPEDGGAGIRFGTQVAIEGNYALVSAPDANRRAGWAYLFDLTTGEQIAKLTSPNQNPEDYFASRIDMSDGLAYVHMPLNRGDTIGSTLFAYDPSTGELRSTIDTPNVGPGGTFPDMAVDGVLALFDGSLANVGTPNSGAVNVFDTVTGEQLFTLRSSTPSAFDNFGSKFSLDGAYAIVSAGFDDADGENAGAAFVFRIPIPGDANDDGAISLADFDILKETFGTQVDSYMGADFDGDSLVGLADFQSLKIHFGVGTPVDVNVPEPSTGVLALFAAGSVGLLSRGRWS